MRRYLFLLHGLSYSGQQRVYSRYCRSMHKGDVYKRQVPEQLEKLYEQFNLQKPADFHSPSMSVSDIVAIKQDGKVSCHYCDSVGLDRKSTRLNSSHIQKSRMPSSA